MRLPASRPKIRSWPDTKRLIADILLWCLLGAFLAAGFINSDKIAGDSFSLRFESHVSGETAYKARQYSIEHGGEEAFWPTFWREDKLSLTSEYADVSADCIVFSGEAGLVWPAEYLSGSAPAVVDEDGCALSAALARKLWGSEDVVGKALGVGEETRIVRGVFEGQRELALVSYRDEDKTQSWSAAELSGGKRWATRGDAASYASSSGLGAPEVVLSGRGSAFAAGFLSALPLIILAIYAIALLIGFVRRQSPIVRTLVPFLLFLGLALALPSLLEQLPGWLIPSRWSDFSAWSSLLGQAQEAVREFLSAEPRFRDVDERLLLLKQAGLCLLSSLCALAVCFRWQIRAKPAAAALARPRRN